MKNRKKKIKKIKENNKTRTNGPNKQIISLTPGVYKYNVGWKLWELQKKVRGDLFVPMRWSPES